MVGICVGYYPDLDMYAFLSCYVSGDLITFSDCMLIDQERGNEYLLLALGDAFGSDLAFYFQFGCLLVGSQVRADGE